MQVGTLYIEKEFNSQTNPDENYNITHEEFVVGLYFMKVSH